MDMRHVIPRRSYLRVLGLALAGGLLVLWQVGANAFEKSSLDIVTKNGTNRFTVELAISPQEQELGLQHRKELAPDHGMLFVFDRVETASFWMKNTIVPLDIIFVNADGSIHRIAENAVPMSLDQIPSQGPVRGVLEVLAGTSKRLGLAPGDKIVHPIFTGK